MNSAESVMRKYRACQEEAEENLLDLLDAALCSLSSRLHNHVIVFADAMGSSSLVAKSVHSGREIELSPLYAVLEDEHVIEAQELDDVEAVYSALMELRSNCSTGYLAKFLAGRKEEWA